MNDYFEKYIFCVINMVEQLKLLKIYSSGFFREENFYYQEMIIYFFINNNSLLNFLPVHFCEQDVHRASGGSTWLETQLWCSRLTFTILTAGSGSDNQTVMAKMSSSCVLNER